MAILLTFSLWVRFIGSTSRFALTVMCARFTFMTVVGGMLTGLVQAFSTANLPIRRGTLVELWE